MLKFISWNVNGLRAVVTKSGFEDTFRALDADIVALQETKLQEGQIDLSLDGYRQYWNYAEKKGYSGTAVFAKNEPLSVEYGMGVTEHDSEGRLITLEYPDFYFIDNYTPNAKEDLSRLAYRCVWEDDFRSYVTSLERSKPVIYCGDLNVAHEEIDIKNPKSNRGHAGFTDEERGKISQMLSAGYTDSFRYLYPDMTGAYSWWSYRFKAREHNAGWRIDYFIVSDKLRDRISGASIHSEIFGSDHCPVELDIDL